jgi:hypothetical protein
MGREWNMAMERRRRPEMRSEDLIFGIVLYTLVSIYSGELEH